MNLTDGDSELILERCKEYKLTIPQTAYVMATAYHETAFSMKPVREGYYLGEPKAENYRKTLRYYPWYGRGYVQLTWDYNYEKADNLLGLEGTLIKNPDRALEPEIASHVIARGMLEGWFTGQKLSDYINSTKKDYYNARRIVNKTDQASKIAGYAQQYEALLNPYPILKKGSKGSAVVDLQDLLESHGLYIGPKVDGDFGISTDAAVRYFQSVKRLSPIDGVVGEDTWKALRT